MPKLLFYNGLHSRLVGGPRLELGTSCLQGVGSRLSGVLWSVTEYPIHAVWPCIHSSS